MTKHRRKLLLQAAIAFACLHQTIGCPQLLGNAVRDGVISFLNTGLTSAVLAGIDATDALLGGGP